MEWYSICYFFLQLGPLALTWFLGAFLGVVVAGASQVPACCMSAVRGRCAEKNKTETKAGFWGHNKNTCLTLRVSPGCLQRPTMFIQNKGNRKKTCLRKWRDRYFTNSATLDKASLFVYLPCLNCPLTFYFTAFKYQEQMSRKNMDPHF